MNDNTVNSAHASPRGTDALCKNLVEASYEKLSEDNLRIFKDRLLDMTGCIFGGAAVAEDRFFADRLIGWGGKPEAPVFTRAERLPAPAAAMINSILARANDFGNMFFDAFGERIASHCGETLIPTGLTLASMTKTSGRDFIVNNIAAEDITARLLYTLPERWPTDMLLVSTAAAALAARYYGLDAEKTKTALSFAATNATDPGNAYYDNSQEFKYHNGESARMGIMAAEIALGGWRGLEDPYFGHWGLISKQAGGGTPALYERCFERLGETFFTESSFKYGPGGIPTAVTAKCGAALRRRITAEYGAFDPEKIKRVRVSRSETVEYNYYSDPFRYREHTAALFSYRFSACCALLRGSVRVSDVQTSSILADPYLAELTENAELDTFKCRPDEFLVRVTAEMKDGRVFEETRDDNESMFEYPTREFLLAKFRDQFDAFGKLPKSVGEKIIELAGRIETLSDMREYTELLRLGDVKP